MIGNPHWLYYVQLLDSALPVGGFSHSFGLETFVQENRIQSADDLDHYLHSQLRTSLIPLEGKIIGFLYRALDERDWERYCWWDTVLDVQRTPRESREAIRKMGKRLLKLSQTLFPNLDFAAQSSAVLKYGGRNTAPAVHTWICHSLEIPEKETVEGYLYVNISASVNSALRLMAIGQTDGQQLIRRAIGTIHKEWAKHEDSEDRPNRDMPFSYAPAQEIRAMNHETLYSRLFMS